MENNPYQSPETTANVNETETEFESIQVFSLTQRLGRVRFLVYSFISQLVLLILFSVIAAGVFSFIEFGKEDVSTLNMIIGVIVYLLYIIISILISLFLGRRRLHDLDNTGWLSLLLLVPLVNLVMFIYLLFFPGTKGSNQYGNKPEPNTTLTWIMLIVVPIASSVFIGIIAAIALPAYNDYVKRAQESEQFID